MLLDGEITLCVTTEILLEYEEMIAAHTNAHFARNALDVLLSLDNLVRIEKYFCWELIPNDADDNKFVDCAIAAGAAFIISEDRAFRQLKNVPFPKVNSLNITEFSELWDFS
ncbi:MAG: PIN domain-containing protein [Saprospiraceae bacterium]